MLNIRVRNERQQSDFEHDKGPLEFGRAQSEDESVKRFVVEDRYVSRNQLRILEALPNELELTNLGSVAIQTSDGQSIEPNQTINRQMPVQLTTGYTTIEFRSAIELSQHDESLHTISRPIRRSEGSDFRPASLLGVSPDPATLTNWFETLLSVQRSAAGSPQFYSETAQAVVELIGLDRGLVLLRNGDEWEIAASHSVNVAAQSRYSRSVLGQVMRQRRTFFQSPNQLEAASLLQVEAVVASPLFDEEDQIVGVVYGSRDTRAGVDARGIQPLEAQLVQLLAGAVSGGLARQKREIEAARVQVQLDLVFPPAVRKPIERNPKLLEGVDRNISVLFSDLRSFSRLSEKLGARDTYRLASYVMNRLAMKIKEYDGVIISYAGDGVAAMWNAPTDQLDHAQRACHTALELQAIMPSINEQWQERVGEQLRIGIGVNSGHAQVGNAGDEKQIHYAPLGHTVNLASRVEGATKQLGVSVLITKATQDMLQGEPFSTRRLCSVRVVGIAGAVELHELANTAASSSWHDLKTKYEAALSHFERQEYDLANEVMATLEGNDDRPTEVLNQLVAQRSQVFELDSK